MCSCVVDSTSQSVRLTSFVLRENELGNKKLPFSGETVNYANWISLLASVCVRVDILVRCRPCMTPSMELPKMTQRGTNPIWVGRG